MVRMPEVGKQFQQQGLFPESDVPKGGPAFQSPEEFRDDPRTVFHASYRKVPDYGDEGSFNSSYPGIHAGTYQSALERAGAHGYFDPYRTRPEHRADNSARGEMNPHIVMQPLSVRGANFPAPDSTSLGSVAAPLTDDEANREQLVKSQKGARAYKNTAEDIGHLSVVYPKRPEFLRQSDWVRAQRNDNYVNNRPKDQGIHPRTAAMYNEGRLDNYDMKTMDEIKAATNTQEGEHPRHDGGLFPYVESTRHDPPAGVNAFPRWKQRYVSREEMADIEAAHGSTNSKEAHPETYPYHDRATKEPYGGSGRRNTLIDDLEDTRQMGSVGQPKVSYANVYPEIASRPKNFPGLGDIERTAPGARDEFATNATGGELPYYGKGKQFVPNKHIDAIIASHNDGPPGWLQPPLKKADDSFAALHAPSSGSNIDTWKVTKAPAKKVAAKKIPAKKVAAPKSGNPDDATIMYAHGTKMAVPYNHSDYKSGGKYY
jgi:hypothetical protein